MGIKLWAIQWERDIPNYTYIVKSIMPWDKDDPHTMAWVVSAVDELDAFRQFNQWKTEQGI